MDLPSLEDLTNAVVDAARHIDSRFGSVITAEIKSDNTPVTEIDRAINARLCVWAEKHGLGFLGEEGNGREDAEYELYVDPLDGTGAFMRGMATITTVATIMRREGQYGIPVRAVIHNPVTGQTWTAAYGRGTYYSRRQGTKRLRINPLIPTAPWRTAISSWVGVDERFASFEKAVLQDSRHFSDQKMGAFAIGGGLIVNGGLHATAITGKVTSAVETAAMTLIVCEAGGVSVDLFGNPLFTFKRGEHKGKMDYLLPNGSLFASHQEVADMLVSLY